MRLHPKPLPVAGQFLHQIIDGIWVTAILGHSEDEDSDDYQKGDEQSDELPHAARVSGAFPSHPHAFTAVTHGYGPPDTSAYQPN
jgi:hypothetical protein